MGKTIILGHMSHSKLVVQDTSISIHRNRERLGKETTGIIYVTTNVSIELGRPIDQFVKALKNTRIPIIIQRVVSKGLFETYKVTRINTGKVPSVSLGVIEVYKGMMVGYVFDQSTLKNRELLKYVRSSALNTLQISNTGDVIGKLKKSLRTILRTESKINHYNRKRLIIIEVWSKTYKVPIEYRCMLGKNGKYAVRAVAIPSSAYIV